jgi:nicotinamide mononucleotide (NMN) deamidase PncC
LLGADIGIATTGEAGPEAEEDVPVGTVYIAAAEFNS